MTFMTVPNKKTALLLAGLLLALSGGAHAGNATASVTPPPPPAATKAKSLYSAVPAVTAISDPYPEPSVIAYSGEQDPYQPNGYLFQKFFFPVPTEEAFLASLTPPVPYVAPEELDINNSFSDQLITGLIQPTGDATFATFKPGVGGITSHNNVEMLTGDLQNANVYDSAQTGTPGNGLPEGVTIRTFLTMDGGADDPDYSPCTPFFLATLQGGETNASNSLDLCSFGEEESGTPNVIVSSHHKGWSRKRVPSISLPSRAIP